MIVCSLMGVLDSEQLSLLELRHDAFDIFLRQRMPMLADLAETLGLADPKLIVADPEAFLRRIATHMDAQPVEEDDFVWVVTRIGYLVGETLIQRLGASWRVNEDPATRTFGRYVVGNFTRVAAHCVVDPMEVAADYADTAAPRDLVGLLAGIEDSLRAVVRTL